MEKPSPPPLPPRPLLCYPGNPAHSPGPPSRGRTRLRPTTGRILRPSNAWPIGAPRRPTSRPFPLGRSREGEPLTFSTPLLAGSFPNSTPPIGEGQPEPSPEAQPHWRTTGSSSRPIGGAAHGPPRTVSATGLGSRLPPPPLGVSEGRPRFSTAPGRERPGGNASGPTQAPPRRPDWPAPPSGKGPFRPAPGRARQSFCGMFTLETSAEFRGPRPPSLPRHPVDAGRPSSRLHGQGPPHASDSPGRRAGAPRREPRRGHGSQQAKRNSAGRASRTGTWRVPGPLCNTQCLRGARAFYLRNPLQREGG